MERLSSSSTEDRPKSGLSANHAHRAASRKRESPEEVSTEVSTLSGLSPVRFRAGDPTPLGSAAVRSLRLCDSVCLGPRAAAAVIALSVSGEVAGRETCRRSSARRSRRIPAHSSNLDVPGFPRLHPSLSASSFPLAGRTLNRRFPADSGLGLSDSFPPFWPASKFPLQRRLRVSPSA